MDNEIIFIVVESLEGGYEARAFGHSIFTEAEDVEELKLNVNEAVECHFDDETCPKIIDEKKC